MIAGHLGLATLVRARVPRLPLWAAVVASLALDLAFVPLVLLGAESLAGSGYGKVTIVAEYTHSMLGAAILAAAAGFAAARRWGRRAGSAIAGLVLSHWLLDLVVHRPDLALAPHDPLPRLGFAGWNHPVFAAVAEAAFVIAGAIAVSRAVPKRVSADAHLHASLVGGVVLAVGFAVLGVDVGGV